MKLLGIAITLVTVLSTPAACAYAPQDPSGAPRAGDRVFVMTADIIGPDRKSALGKNVPDGDHKNFPDGRPLVMHVDADACAGFTDPANEDPCPVNAKRPPGAKLPIGKPFITSFRHVFAVAPDFHDVIHFELYAYRTNDSRPGLVDVIPYGYTIRCEIIEQGKPGTIAANAARVTDRAGGRVETTCDRSIRV